MDRLIIQLGRSRLIISLIVIVGFTMGYLNYESPDDLVAIINDPVSTEDTLKKFENFNLNFSILEDERYKSLEIFGENPVDPGVTGERKNPFAPIGEE